MSSKFEVLFPSSGKEIFSDSAVIPRKIWIENTSRRNVCNEETVMDHDSHKRESENHKHSSFLWLRNCGRFMVGGQLVKNISSLPIYFGAHASINATGIFRP